ncbi:MAG: histidine kinase [Eubacterium sp.]|nr:histidine kinase [Eubacterium sp.]
MFKRVFKGKIPAVIIVGLLIAVFASLVALGVRFYLGPMGNDVYESVFLDGKYSVDGGEWKTINNSEPIRDTFHEIRFRGTLSGGAVGCHVINISTNNVWYTLQFTDGRTMVEHTYQSLEEHRDKIIQDGGGDMPEDMIRDLVDPQIEFLKEHNPYEVKQATPGYKVKQLYYESWMEELDETYTEEDGGFLLTVWNPYPSEEVSFSDCFRVFYCSESEQLFVIAYTKLIGPFLFFFIILLFGVLFFPVAGFIQGRIDYKYITFGVLCFFWSFYMFIKSAAGFLNIWISDSVVCLVLVKISEYLFIIALLLYLRSNLKEGRGRVIAGILTLLFAIAMVATGILQMTGTADLIVTGVWMNYLAAAGILFPILLLLAEVKIGRSALAFLISWGPLALSILVGLVLSAFDIPSPGMLMYGIAFTMIYQIIRLIGDLRRQYRETIRYQQMQKELYEAEVAVMVSQIQPHFMYNALSSIAMLCKINPDTAYDATIAFSEYLRGNMDSLKQKEPVPFEKELEHLKKYLFIEKLRFGKKLNVEYDIQTMDFVVPQLSVQPLVENAVKHGVGQKKKGGTVKIMTKETGDGYEIVISDDGVGFDVNAPRKEDGRSHVGMDNTRRRLKEMIGAEVVIESTVGEGTTARVVIPRKESDEVSS